MSGYEPRLDRIKLRNDDLRERSDEDLQARFQGIRSQIGNGADLSDFVVDVFALVSEASDRILHMRLYDVQVMAGLALHDGHVLDMKTGEGKTLSAVAPAILNSLGGDGVHILTFNDYLARRDCQWMRPVYEFFGLSVACIQERMERSARKHAYACDVTYATAKEVGFDHLRDQIQTEPAGLVQRSFHYAIVDEADSILIDEARIPLVISGIDESGISDEHQTKVRIARLVKGFERGVDYDVDENARNVFLQEAGARALEDELQCGNLYHRDNLRLLTSANLALHVEVLLRRDRDYIVRNGRIEIVDEFTGRVVSDRRWPDGMQSALEVKESLRSDDEGVVLGSITMQHFIAQYSKICGMTGTAIAAANEFNEFYGLSTQVVPTNRPCRRIDEPDLVFTHREAKDAALLDEISRLHRSRRPVLVGTSTVDESERLAGLIRNRGIDCQVLNAKNDELEAQIVSRAGGLGRVTICTNIAGRGTDIVLGPDSAEEHSEVVSLGGLYVIGTNRHESRRIDDQLRGRAGRQGDPGGSRFFLSLDDELLSRFGIAELMPPEYRRSRQESAIEHKMLDKRIDYVQRVIEGQNLEIRITLRKQSSLLEEQRLAVREMRDAVLRGQREGSLLRTRAAERWSALELVVGEEVLETVERQITLYYLDKLWTAHLATVRDVLETTPLHSVGAGPLGVLDAAIVGGTNTHDFYRRSIHDAFMAMMNELEEEVVTAFDRVEVTERGIDPDKEGLRGPSSTWTYLITDDAFSTGFGEGLAKRVKQLVAKKRLH